MTIIASKNPRNVSNRGFKDPRRNRELINVPNLDPKRLKKNQMTHRVIMAGRMTIRPETKLDRNDVMASLRCVFFGDSLMGDDSIEFLYGFF